MGRPTTQLDPDCGTITTCQVANIGLHTAGRRAQNRSDWRTLVRTAYVRSSRGIIMIMNTNCKGQDYDRKGRDYESRGGSATWSFGPLLPLLLGYWHQNQFIRFEYIVFTSLIDEWTNELAEGDERKRQERNASASKSSSTGIK